VHTVEFGSEGTAGSRIVIVGGVDIQQPAAETPCYNAVLSLAPLCGSFPANCARSNCLTLGVHTTPLHSFPTVIAPC
jgi:hypothetical protein